MSDLLTPQHLHAYQRECVLHQLYNNDSMLWLQMGLGKTPITLTTIVDRMNAGQVQKVLIFGPLRVIQAVWARESRKWTHTKHLRFSVIHGNKEKRLRALFTNADIYLINYENMNWLADMLEHYYLAQEKPLPFQMVVYDEVSKLKNSTSLRMAGGNRDRRDRRGEVYKIKVTGWRKMIPHFQYRTGLTGTPASNGYLDLHGQYLAVDNGKRLGEYVTGFKDRCFASDYMGWSYSPTEFGKTWIENQIGDITIKMDAKDYLDMPEKRVVNMMVDLPDNVRKAYKDIENELFTRLDSGSEVEVFSKSSVSNKCLQFCIAEGTDVLTDSGWKPIEVITASDKVWDGGEWSSVDGITFNGYKKVIECDGVWMTPDHKVLTISGWVESQEVVYGNASDRFNRVDVRLPHGIETCEYRKQESEVAGTMCVRKGIRSDRSKFKEPEQTGCEVMRMSKRGGDSSMHGGSWDGEDQTIHRVDQYAIPLQEPEGQRLSELWGKGYRSMQRMVRLFCRILERYGFNIQTTSDYRTSRQQRELLQRELQVVDETKTTEQHSQQCVHSHADGEDHSDSGCAAIQPIGQCDICSNQERVERTRVDSTSRITKVYDLIDAGERHRFTVRGCDGQLLIVHNCNGTPYLSSESPEYEALHDAKMDALEEVLEEAGGSPVLCSYSFRSDAKRIMEKFKKYAPVNLTEAPSKDTEKIINKWNEGKIRLLIGHPACLGADTLVLTERDGWVRIVSVRTDDRVHDGVEFVNHAGCQFSGVKPVIDVFGMTMTPDHKLLVKGEWVEARNVEDSEAKRTQAVYDLVDCGPRHRFLIRNPDGEVFISHNSMGHGVDGLQQSGSIVVWFGLNWSLEMYEQMNGRLDRQGQTRPVSVIRILCRDTVDLAVADAIERKTDDQNGLKDALQRYRNGITTNELEVNFF